MLGAAIIRPMFRPDRRVPFVNAVYSVISGSGSLVDVSVLLCGLEEKHGVFFRPIGDRPLMPDDVAERWVKENLHPFLDETHLVLAGMTVCNEFDVCDRQGSQLCASSRAWGAIVAEWANRRGWPNGALARTWSYLDFYVNGPEMLGYEDFERDVLEAMRLP